LFATFYVEQDPRRASSTIALTKIDSKHYPLRLSIWSDFSSAHQTKFAQLTQTFGNQTLLPSPSDVRGVRRQLSADGAADESDIRPFIRASIEKPTATILAEYLRLRKHPTIKTIAFKNNAYGLGLHLDEHNTTATEGHPILLASDAAAAAATTSEETAGTTAGTGNGRGGSDEPPKKKNTSSVKDWSARSLGTCRPP
jgi:hypothetical protein